jgi:hypothetical protein
MTSIASRSNLALGVVALLWALSGCGKNPTVSNSSSRPAASPVVERPTAQNGADLLSAFRTAFGEPAPFVSQVDEGGDSNPGSYVTLAFSPEAFIDIGPGLVALVSKGEGTTTGCDSHACAGALMVHYLRKDLGGFTLLGHWNVPNSGVGYGKAAPWTVRTDLDDVPTMVLQAADGGQGCFAEQDTLIALTPTGPEDRGSFTRYSEDQQEPASPDNYKYDGTILPLERGVRFAVDYRGSSSKRVVFTKLSDGTFADTDMGSAEFPPTC